MSLLRFSLSTSPRSKKRSPSPSRDSGLRPSKLQRTSSFAALSTAGATSSSENMSPLRRTDTYTSLASLCAPAAINLPAPVPLPPVTTLTAVPMPPQPSTSSNTNSSSSSSSSSTSSSSSIPYTRTLRYYKEQRERSKALIQSGAPAEQDTLFFFIANALLKQTKQQQPSSQDLPASIFPTPIGSSSRGIRITCRSTHSKAPQQQQFPAKPKRSKQRKSSAPRFRPAFTPTSSPLAPRPHTSSTMHNMRPAFDIDPRPMVPRARRAPDLYRLAIKACMRQSREGQQLLSLGPRLACKLGDATKELEKIVETENGLPIPPRSTTQLAPSQTQARPALRPLRPLVRTESYADLSMFIQPPTPTPVKLACDVHMADTGNSEGDVDGIADIDLDEEDWEMFDFTA